MKQLLETVKAYLRVFAYILIGLPLTLIAVFFEVLADCVESVLNRFNWN